MKLTRKDDYCNKSDLTYAYSSDISGRYRVGNIQEVGFWRITADNDHIICIHKDAVITDNIDG